MQLEVGGIYEGKVTGITKFGAFVSFEGGQTGMVHISEIAPTFVTTPAGGPTALAAMETARMAFTRKAAAGMALARPGSHVQRLSPALPAPAILNGSPAGTTLVPLRK